MGVRSEQSYTLTLTGWLAGMFNALGRKAEAEPLEHQILEVFGCMLGPEHSGTLNVIGNLAGSLNAFGRASEAELLARRALGRRDRILGPKYPKTLFAMHNLAVTLHVLGRVAEAESFARRRLEISTRLLAPENLATFTAASNMAWTLWQTDRALSALSPARSALSCRLARVGRSSWSSEAMRAALGAKAGAAGLGCMGCCGGGPGALSVDEATLAALPENQSAALRSETFAAVQEAVVRAWERALAMREALNRQFVDLVSAEPGTNSTTMTAHRSKLEVKRHLLDDEIDITLELLEVDYPRCFDLMSPAAVSIAELQGAEGAAPLLGGTEVLVLLSPPEGALMGLVWAVMRDGVAWAEIPLSRKLAWLPPRLDGGQRRAGRRPGLGREAAAR